MEQDFSAGLWSWVFAVVGAGATLYDVQQHPWPAVLPLFVMIKNVFRCFQKCPGGQITPLVKNPYFGGFHISFVNIINLLKI